MNWSEQKVTVTGGAGFLGRVICRKLAERGCRQIDVPRRQDYDLTTEKAVERMYDDFRPDVVIHLAAEVGGIGANQDQPGRFFFANMAMGMHLIEHARRTGVEKFVQVGTVCSYPKFTNVPFVEDDLWKGYPEETNAPYGVAKKALLVMLQAYREQYDLNGIYLLPANLYGPGDNFDPASSHVIPAVKVWGKGKASREFLYVEDCARAIIAATQAYDDPAPVNIGTGAEITIADLVELIRTHVGYAGEVRWDTSKPDGQPRRCLDTSLARKAFGFVAETKLADGLRLTIDWYRRQS